MDLVCKNNEQCLNILNILVSFLRGQKTTILSHIEKQESTIDVALFVVPIIEQLIVTQLVELLEEEAEYNNTEIDLGDINLKGFLKLCNKYNNNKSIVEKLNEFDQAFMPMDPAIFQRKKK